jgi:hypothetical protein
MDQAIGTIVLCGGISAAIVGIAAFSQWCHDWRRLWSYLSDDERHPTCSAYGEKSLEEQEREAEALMQAHP